MKRSVSRRGHRLDGLESRRASGQNRPPSRRDLALGIALLARRIPQGDAALALRRLLRHFVDVCNALAYVHHRGVIHRDLKPENIMIGPYGETFVVDWGLAKIVGRGENEMTASNSAVAGETPCKTLRPPSADSPVATQVGSAIGTLAYMSPEQAAGLVDQLRPSSDLYALGAILYAILTGQPPMQGTNPESIRQDVLLNRYPRPREVRPEIPAPLEAVCVKAMALDPRQRYQSAKEIADEIEAWMADEPVRAWREPLRLRAARQVRRHRSLVVGSAAAMVVAMISLSVGMALLAKANQRVRHSESIAVQREEDARWNFRLARNAVDRYLTLACCELGAAQVVALRPEEAGKAYEAAIDALEVAVPLCDVLAVADDAQWLASQLECDGPTAYRTAVLLAQAAEAVTHRE